MKTTIRAILQNRNGLFLFVQHNEWNPADRGKWATVGGRIEDGESDEACLARELSEEFGNLISQRIRIGPKIFTSSRPDRVDHFYFVAFDGEDLIVEAKDEILNHRWFSPIEAKGLNFFFGFEADLCAKFSSPA